MILVKMLCGIQSENILDPKKEFSKSLHNLIMGIIHEDAESRYTLEQVLHHDWVTGTESFEHDENVAYSPSPFSNGSSVHDIRDILIKKTIHIKETNDAQKVRLSNCQILDQALANSPIKPCTSSNSKFNSGVFLANADLNIKLIVTKIKEFNHTVYKDAFKITDPTNCNKLKFDSDTLKMKLCLTNFQD